jgi:hypothetical protein
MAEEKPKLQTATETFRVYGQDIDVTYNYIEDPEKGKLLQLDKIGGRIKLNPSQEVLSNQLFLPEYIKAKHKTDPKQADTWLSGVLQEIIIDKCRTDRDIIAAKPCTNFQAYLMQLAAQIQRDPTKIPYVPESRIGSVIEIKKRIAKTAAETAQESIGSAEDYGSITITFTINLADIFTHAGKPEAEPEAESDAGSDSNTESEEDDIEKDFEPSDCKREKKYRIDPDVIKSYITAGDTMEALYLIFKQYRGKTCNAGNILADAATDDEDLKKLLNQGRYQFRQYRRLHKIRS